MSDAYTSSLSCSVQSFPETPHQNKLGLREWLHGYARGLHAPGGEVPELPISGSPESISSTLVYSDTESPSSDYSSEEAHFRKLGWLPPPLPPDEVERIKALYRYGILTSDPDNPGGMDRNPTLNKIVRMAQKVFDVPAVVALLVDKDKLPVLASVGYRAPVYVRESSMCGHSILLGAPHIILDAFKDFRFTNLHPYTSTEAPMRFYAGTQLRNQDGFALGTLCLIDDKPHEQFTAADKELLVDFGKLVMNEIERSMTQSHLARASHLSAVIDHFNREVSAIGDLAEETNLQKVYALAAERIHNTLDLNGGCSILDISRFSAVRVLDTSSINYQILDPLEALRPLPIISESKSTLSADLSPPKSPIGPTSTFSSTLKPSVSLSSVAATTLRKYDSERLGRFLDNHPSGKLFNADEIPTWIGYSFSPDVQNVLIIPVLSINRSALALICVWSCGGDLREFLDIECQFVRTIEGVLMSSSILKSIQGADHAKFAFISNMSHELRTPLHGILANADLLSDTPLSKEQLAYVNTVKICGSNLLDTVNHVLDYTKSAANIWGEKRRNSTPPEMTILNISDFVEESVSSVCLSYRFAVLQQFRAANSVGSLYDANTSIEKAQRRDEKGGVEVLLDFEENMEDMQIAVDETGLRRVIYNLMTNALKYTKRGTIRVLVRSEVLDSSRRSISISVIDTGTGMSRAFLKDGLFSPFSQEIASHPGAGLGLSITNEIIRSMDGQIDVQSVENKGSTFRVTLPLDVVPRIKRLPIANPPPSEYLGQGHTVHIMGLSNSSVQLLSIYLSRWKFNIDTSPVALKKDIIILGNLVDEACAKSYATGYRVVRLFENLRQNDSQPMSHHLVLVDALGPGKLRSTLQTLLSVPISSEETPNIPMAELAQALPVPTSRVRRSKEKVDQLSYQSAFKSHVLIVEDNPINRSIFRAYFHKKKILYKEAYDGQHGVNMFESHPPGFFAFVAMDLQMPVMDGLDSARGIRKIEKERMAANLMAGIRPVTICALTGSSSSESRKNSVEVGMNGYLVKPVRFTELWALVEGSSSF
ncbi:two-component sensor molecule [Phaffia rhodozyma]|uniref:histidine kinase n=1 Tax=Phaffia rhodozyma TaxID=264483 RepID=A0A0F7SH17_PHARH|nr:two-component sensor molecule [Phaffia rhodozyma]